MLITVLLENTAVDGELCHAHGLSLYIETPRHRVLFDMGPDSGFAANAGRLGVDLSGVDLAVLSHGHYDHGGGLATFLERNDHAPICIHQGAFGSFWAQESDQLRYIGLDPALQAQRDRFAMLHGVTRLDGELLMFDSEDDGADSPFTGGALKERLEDGTLGADEFRHEQNLLITAGGRAVLVAGCAHRGIVKIRRRAETLLGRELDAVVSGFHLFVLRPGSSKGDALIDRTGRELAEGGTVYYTGHCTGDYAYDRLKPILGERLRRISGGMTIVI